MELKVTISDERGEDSTDLVAEIIESRTGAAFSLDMEEECWVVLASDPLGVAKLEQLQFALGEAIKAFKRGAK